MSRWGGGGKFDHCNDFLYKLGQRTLAQPHSTFLSFCLFNKVRQSPAVHWGVNLPARIMNINCLRNVGPFYIIYIDRVVPGV